MSTGVVLTHPVRVEGRTDPDLSLRRRLVERLLVIPPFWVATPVGAGSQMLYIATRRRAA